MCKSPYSLSYYVIIFYPFTKVLIRLFKIMMAADSIIAINLSLLIDLYLLITIKGLVNLNNMLLELLISWNVSYDGVI